MKSKTAKQATRFRIGATVGGGLAVLVALGVFGRDREQPAPGLPEAAGPATDETEPARPPERCELPSLPVGAIAPPGPGLPDEPALRREVEWSGQEVALPVRPPAPPQERSPTGISFQRVADKLGSQFKTMSAPPPEKAFERSFQEYAENLSTKLQLEGDRADLSTVRLSFFDRRNGQSEGDRSTQDETVRKFLEAVGADAALSAEVLSFVERARAGGGDAPPHRERGWGLGDNQLFVSVTPSYGAGLIEVRRFTPQPTNEGQPS